MLLFACVITVFLYKYVLANDHGILILVNHIVMSEDNNKVLYYYKEGDLVDVACINFDAQCTIRLEYNFIEKQDDKYKTKDMLSLHAVGFRTKLKAANHHSQVVCNCKDSKKFTRMKFILKNKFDELMHVKINGLNIRNLEMGTRRILLFKSSPKIIKYVAYTNENITVECYTEKLNVTLYWENHDNSFFRQRHDNRILEHVPAEKWTSLTLIASEMTKDILLKEVIYFEPLQFSLTENRHLLMKLPKENVQMEFYNYEGKQLLYYTYEDGDHLPLNCSQLFNAAPKRIIFESPVEYISSEGSLNKNIKLNPNYNNTMLKCYFLNNDVEVRAILRHELPDLVVLVNRFVLSTERDPNEPIRTAVYHYSDGDMVDVSCAIKNELCSVELNYDYAEDLHEAFKTADLLSSRIVGFRTKLQVKHSNSNLVCKCICDRRITIIIKLKFILGHLQHGVNNKIKLKINGMIAREMILHEYSVNNEVSLLYNWGSEKLNIEAETKSVGTILNWYYDNAIREDVEIHSNNATFMNITLFPRMLILVFNILHNSERFIDITIHFVNLPVFKSFDLTLNLPKENIIMELYKYPGRQWFYYEYQNDDILTLTCSSSYTMQDMLISFNGTEERCKKSISLNFHLTAVDDDTTHECLLKKDAETMREITTKIIVVFNQREQNNSKFIISCSVGLAVIVLVICIVWWKMRKRRIEKVNAEMYMNTTVDKTNMRPMFPEPNMPAIHGVVTQCQVENTVTYANMSVEIQEQIKSKSKTPFSKRLKKLEQNLNIGKNRKSEKTPNESSSRQNRKPEETPQYDYVRRSQITRSIKCRNIREGQTQNISYSESVKEDVYDYTIGY